MRKQIDPNLNNGNSEALLFGENNKSEFIIVQDNDDNHIEHKKSGNDSSHHTVDSEHHHHHHHSSGSGAHHHHSSNNGAHHHHHSSNGSSHHHHSHHHSHSKKKNKMPKWAKIILIIILIIALLMASIFGVFKYIQIKGQKDLMSIANTEAAYEEIIEYKGHTYKFNKDVFSVAFFGVDQRSFLSADETDFVGSADADLVITVNSKTGDVKIISIPRDTMVDVDQYSDNGVFLKTDNVQLCLAYAYGDGSEKSNQNVIKAMSRILHDVPIEKYFTLDLDGVAPINDAMGGVTLKAMYNLPEDGIKKGETVTLRGDAAEHYVRTRDMDKLDASLKRADRQVQYVQAFINQLIPAVRNDFGVVSKLYNTASKYSRTNITLNNVTYMASFLLQKGNLDYEVYKIDGTLGKSIDSKYPDTVHAEFYPDEDSVMETVLSVYYTQVN